MNTPDCIFSRRFGSIPVPLGFLALASLWVGLFLVTGSVLAGDETGAKKETKKEAVTKPAKKADETVVVTGSLIPQKMKASRLPATTSPVVIISRQDIERSGATTVAQALRMQGLGR